MDGEAQRQVRAALSLGWDCLRTNRETVDDICLSRNRAMAALECQWNCILKAPETSPYKDQTFRLAVRFPRGFPSYPPDIQVLSIILHSDISQRDPREGQLSQEFYETLAVCAGAPLPEPTPKTSPPDIGQLRFAVGENVRCNVGDWVNGTVVKVHYSEPDWPEDVTVPYQVRLTDGRLIYAPMDSDRLIRERKAYMPPLWFDSETFSSSLDGETKSLEHSTGPETSTSGFCGQTKSLEYSSRPSLHFDLITALALFYALLSAPLSQIQDFLYDKLSQQGGLLCERRKSAAQILLQFADSAQSKPTPNIDSALALEDFAKDSDNEFDDTSDDSYELWSRLAQKQAKNYALACRYRSEFSASPSLYNVKDSMQIPSEWIAPKYRDALEAHAQGNSTAIRHLMDEVVPGVFVVEMMTQTFCDLLLDEVDRFEQTPEFPAARPNSMNKYGLILNGVVGLEKTMDILQSQCVAPLGEALYGAGKFGFGEGVGLDHHHSFVVAYRAGEDLGLDMHTDACDVTVNICLGKEFQGGELTLCGLRGTNRSKERRHQHTYVHKPGYAIVHLGRQRHGAMDITNGERYNLIMWSKSSQFRQSRNFYHAKARQVDSGGVEDPRENVPDLVCLSYTHDPDYEDWKPYPPGKRPEIGVGGG